ncbi:MAG: hypothetical protein M1827_000480 [Pycnora praestabilis]|nr:MAG: hypothetical protein M1827_000480 [Pycnora praestabilis]
MSSAGSSTVPPNANSRAAPGAFPNSTSFESPVTISTQHSLSQAVHARRAEFTRAHTVRIKVGSWNVASLSGTEKDVGGWFVDGKGISEALSGLTIDSKDQPQTYDGSGEGVDEQEARRTKKKSTLPKNDPAILPGGNEIGIYALGLQEIVDINSATEALRPYIDPYPSKKWRKAVAEALPSGYQLVAEQQMIGLLLLIFASPEFAPMVTSVSTTSVGTGVMGYMGNKGAVTARLILGETTRLVFINSHLAAGTDKGTLDRRNWDAAQIVSRTKFDPVSDGAGVMEEFSEGIGEEDFAFWFGDLNYRIEDLPGDDVRRLLMLHTRNEYDIGQPAERKIEKEIVRATAAVKSREIEGRGRSSTESTASSATAVDQSVDNNSITSSITLPSEALDPNSDPTSLQTTLSSLLSHDQLHAQQKARKAFHDGWQEGPITFLPTYKYDVGSVGLFDTGEKKRGPSWCDRILYRTRRGRLEFERKVKNEEQSKKRDEEMKAKGIDLAEAEDQDVLFDYDPDADGADDSFGEYEENVDGENGPEVIVTKDGFEDKLHLDLYTSHQRVLSSDHKPLDAIFTLTFDAVVPELKARIHQEVTRELDREENEGRPCITIVVDHHHADHDGTTNSDENSADFEGVNFGEIRYLQAKLRGITVANTGRVSATFSFLNRPTAEGNPGGACPPWLSMQFDRQSDNFTPNIRGTQEFTLHPGDAVNVTMHLRITDIEQVRSLNEGREKIEDVLVLRVSNGRDHFLPVRGTWMQSSFGRSIDKLIRIPEGGVRKLQHQRPGGSGSSDESGVKWSAPRELFRLTESIEDLVERTIAEWSMTAPHDNAKPPWDAAPGWPFDRTSWTCKDGASREALKYKAYEALDTDQSLSTFLSPDTLSVHRLEIFAETLLDFLRVLEEGIITEALWADLEKGMMSWEKEKKHLNGEETRAWILEILSTAPYHNVSFVFLTSMLSRVADEIAPLRSQASGTRSSIDISKSPRARSRARTLSQDPSIAKRQLVDQKFAAIFAEVIIRSQFPPKDRERRASEERKKEAIEVFLRAKREM